MENTNKSFELDITKRELEQISGDGIVAIDCETGGLNPIRDRLYLVQLATANEEIKLIKTADGCQAPNLKKLLTDGNITKVFHFAIMDCGFLLCHFNITVQGAYCTKIASKLTRTYAASHSLSTLIKEFFSITVDKNLQSSFWGAAEISASQMAYASNDVKYLLRIKTDLERILQEKGSLASGISYVQLNQDCQRTIPLLTHLWINGWDFGKEDPNSVFGK